jgi:hypothetical protein
MGTYDQNTNRAWFKVRKLTKLTLLTIAVLFTIVFTIGITPVLVFDVFYGTFGLHANRYPPLLDFEYLKVLIVSFLMMSVAWCLYFTVKGTNEKYAWLAAVLVSSLIFLFLP